MNAPIYADLGTKVLGLFIKKETNISIINRYIYENSTSKPEYTDLLYECIGYLTQNGVAKNKESLKSLISNIAHGDVMWNHSMYETFRDQHRESDDFLMNPFEIEEGILECRKCNSKRTFSFQRQTRSADEGSTTFAQCADCGNKWRHNN